VAGRPGDRRGDGLTIRERCDLAYVIQVEQRERRVLAAQQVIATFLAGGAKGMEMPDPDEDRRQFDAWLIEEPKVVDPVDAELLRRLGLRVA
jgi:hypothetical protein